MHLFSPNKKMADTAQTPTYMNLAELNYEVQKIKSQLALLQTATLRPVDINGQSYEWDVSNMNKGERVKGLIDKATYRQVEIERPLYAPILYGTTISDLDFYKENGQWKQNSKFAGMPFLGTADQASAYYRYVGIVHKNEAKPAKINWPKNIKLGGIQYEMVKEGLSHYGDYALRCKGWSVKPQITGGHKWDEDPGTRYYRLVQEVDTKDKWAEDVFEFLGRNRTLISTKKLRERYQALTKK
jgi:hypothetical protein